MSTMQLDRPRVIATKPIQDSRRYPWRPGATQRSVRCGCGQIERVWIGKNGRTPHLCDACVSTKRDRRDKAPTW